MTRKGSGRCRSRAMPHIRLDTSCGPSACRRPATWPSRRSSQDVGGSSPRRGSAHTSSASSCAHARQTLMDGVQARWHPHRQLPHPRVHGPNEKQGWESRHGGACTSSTSSCACAAAVKGSCGLWESG